LDIKLKKVFCLGRSGGTTLTPEVPHNYYAVSFLDVA